MASMSLVSSCSCLCPNYWSQVLNQEWRCCWSSADRRSSNYIWVINKFIVSVYFLYLIYVSFFSSAVVILDCVITALFSSKRLNGFSWNFKETLDIRQGTIWNILLMMFLTLWSQGWFCYFLDTGFLATLQKNRWTDFHEIFRVCRRWHNKLSGKTVSCLTRLFHSSHTWHGIMSVTNITGKWMNGFSWNFQDRTAMTQRTDWNILRMLCLTPWIQGLLLFLDPHLFFITFPTAWKR